MAFGLGLPFLALRGEVECFEDTGAVSFEQGLGVAPWVHTDRDTKTLDDAFALHWNGNRKPWDLDRCDEETRPYFLRYLARSPGLYGGHVAVGATTCEVRAAAAQALASPLPRGPIHCHEGVSRGLGVRLLGQAYAWYSTVYKFTEPKPSRRLHRGGLAKYGSQFRRV